MLEEEKLLYLYLVEELCIEDDTINMITSIFGFNIEVLESILYYKTGYHSLDQIKEGEK